MDRKIRIGIAGYGNLGRGTELAVYANPDMTLVGVFSRRDPSRVTTVFSDTKVYAMNDIEDFRDKIDVMILCGGSATDLPEQTPALAAMFHTVDSFDTHAMIPDHFAKVDDAAKRAGKVAILSVGWDPGLFSLNRLYSEAVLPNGSTYTFWGKGVSQGHSDAIRRVPGVKNAIQYTIPIEAAVNEVRSGSNPELSARQKHLRECYVVLEEGADAAEVEQTIKNMPNYFSDYDTIVHFISEEELARDHASMPHGGFVIRSGKTGENNKHIYEFSIKLDSNPEFTSSVLVAYARAAYRMQAAGETGARSVFDVAPALLSPKTAQQLRKELL